MSRADGAPMHDVVIIGAGQAGLATAYGLQKRGIQAKLIDRSSSIGASWRARYDSLVLFTPSQYSALPGMQFPLARDLYPTKDQVADYLAAYASRHDFRVDLNTSVRKVLRNGAAYEIHTSTGSIRARNVVVATGPHEKPAIPEFAGALRSDIAQLHSSSYRNPTALPDGEVLVVGSGNSGLQIAVDIAARRSVLLSMGGNTLRLPQRLLGKDIFFWLRLMGILASTRACLRGGADSGRVPVIGSSHLPMIKSGQIRTVSRVAGAQDGNVVCEDGESLNPNVIIWSTGYRLSFDWLQVDNSLQKKRPIHVRGVSPVRGLYFIGLSCLHRRSSAFLGFVGKDADHVAQHIYNRGSLNFAH
jgi:putative flavoprotein involved in K+ transport